MLIKLEKIDPNAVKRAKTFFPIPSPAAPKKEDSSSLLILNGVERALVQGGNQKSIRVASLSESFAVSQLVQARSVRDRSIQNASQFATLSTGGNLNLWAPVVVLAVATIMLAIVMWNIATNGGLVAQVVLGWNR